MRSVLFPLLLIVAAVIPVHAEDPALAPAERARLEARFCTVAEQVRPATVAILGLIGMGSGVVIDAGGLVLTNAHVALMSRHVAVVFPDGRRVLGKRLGIYFPRDLALIQLPEGNYAAVEPARIGSTTVGDWVVAYGHPGGIKPDGQPTFSAGQITGSVAADGAQVMGLLNYAGGIETDISIYSGNSGGPLFDLDGRFLGINGAANRLSGASFTLGLDIIADVLPKLTEEKVWLSDQVTLDAREPALQALFASLDKMSLDRARQWLEHGWPSEQMPAAGAVAAPEPKWAKQILDALDRAGQGRAARRISRVAGRVAEARQSRLTGGFGPELHTATAGVVSLHDAEGVRAFGTVVAPGLVVTKASLLRAGATVRVVAADGQELGELAPMTTNGEHDLLLGRVVGLRGVVWRDAQSLPPVGAWLLSPQAGAPGVVGVLSARARAIPAVAASLTSEALQRGLMFALTRLLRSAPEGSELRQLADALEANDRGREYFEGGNEPRTYPRVLQHDAPLGREEMGGPVLDGEGRLVGINIARAHHGTTYVVPIDVVRASFREALNPAGENK